MRKTIFHEDRWLDNVAAGSWRDIRCSRGNEVAGYLRFLHVNRLGFKCCEMPQMSRVLGPVITSHSNKAEVRNRNLRAVILELLEGIADYDQVRMTLDPGFTNLAPFLACGYNVSILPDLQLNCKQPIDVLWSGLRKQARNIIRNARETLTVEEVTDVNQFVDFYRQNLANEYENFDLSLIAPVFAGAHPRNQCKILSSVDSSGNPHVMNFYLWDDKYLYFFLETRNKDIAHAGAASLLVWSGLELAHERGLYFDFDSDITTDRRHQFSVAFGGESAHRYLISRSTAPYKLARATALRARRTWRSLGKRTWRKMKTQDGEE